MGFRADSVYSKGGIFWFMDIMYEQQCNNKM